MEKVELRPCPLCGGDTEIWKAHNNPNRNAWIACMSGCAVLTREHPTTEKAIATWNARPREEALEAALHRACKMLATLADEMHETAEDRFEIEEFQSEAAALLQTESKADE